MWHDDWFSFAPWFMKMDFLQLTTDYSILCTCPALVHTHKDRWWQMKRIQAPPVRTYTSKLFFSQSTFWPTIIFCPISDSPRWFGRNNLSASEAGVSHALRHLSPLSFRALPWSLICTSAGCCCSCWCLLMLSKEVKDVNRSGVVSCILWFVTEGGIGDFICCQIHGCIKH